MRTRFLSSSPMIVVARALLVALAAAAVVAGFAVTRKSAPRARRERRRLRLPDAPRGDLGDAGRMSHLPDGAGTRKPPAPARGRPAEPAEPPSLTLPRGIKLAGFDSVSRVKQFESSFDMRAWAWAESRDVGVALYPRDQAEILKPGEEGLFEPESGPRGPNPHGIKVHLAAQAPEPWDAATVLVRFRLDDHAGAALAAEGDRLGQVRDPAAQRPGGAGIGGHSIARRTVRPDRVGGPADVHEAAGPDRQHALRVRRRRGRRARG